MNIRKTALTSVAVLALTGGIAVAATTAAPPIPAPYPGAMIGDALFRIGPGTQVVDTSDGNPALVVDCAVEEPFVNIQFAGGKSVQLPIFCD